MDWVATVMTLVGLLLTARRNSIGWLIGMAANLVWAYYGACRHEHALVTINVLIMAISLYGFDNWRKHEPATRPNP